jgi:hypothetical protein
MEMLNQWPFTILSPDNYTVNFLLLKNVKMIYMTDVMIRSVIRLKFLVTELSKQEKAWKITF